MNEYEGKVESKTVWKNLQRGGGGSVDFEFGRSSLESRKHLERLDLREGFHL